MDKKIKYKGYVIDIHVAINIESKPSTHPDREDNTFYNIQYHKVRVKLTLDGESVAQKSRLNPLYYYDDLVETSSLETSIMLAVKEGERMIDKIVDPPPVDPVVEKLKELGFKE